MVRHRSHHEPGHGYRKRRNLAYEDPTGGKRAAAQVRPRKVKCPTCGAEPGEKCRRADGKPNVNGTIHVERRRKAIREGFVTRPGEKDEKDGDYICPSCQRPVKLRSFNRGLDIEEDGKGPRIRTHKDGSEHCYGSGRPWDPSMQPAQRKEEK